MDENTELLYKLDKRLAVLEALSTQHAAATSVQNEKLEKQLTQVQKEITTLKVKQAGVSAGVSAFVAILAHLFGGFR